jgi:hypothetical protein
LLLARISADFGFFRYASYSFASAVDADRTAARAGSLDDDRRVVVVGLVEVAPRQQATQSTEIT